MPMTMCLMTYEINLERKKVGKMSNKISIKNLEDVKIGDEFVVEVYTYTEKLRIVKCTHITPKQVTIGDYKYRKDNAFGIGGKYFTSPPTLYEATDELRLEIKKKNRRNFVLLVNYKELSDEQIEAIYKILKGES